MKIIQVEDIFHPETGYQINILSKYMVQFGHEVTIITARLDKIKSSGISFFGADHLDQKDQLYSEKYGVKIIRLSVNKIVSGRVVFGKELFYAIQKEKPDVVYIHGNDTLTGMRYLLQYKKLGYPLIMDSHMLEMASTNRFNKIFRKVYKSVFTPIIIKNKIQVIRTQDDPYVEKCLGIPLSQAPWISVGSDTMLFHPDKEAKMSFRRKYEISKDDFVIIYAGKLDESKGGMLLAEAIQKKLHVNKGVTFLIVGKAVGEYGRQVEKTLKASENRVLRFPTQKYEDLAGFYQAADMAIFPRQCSLSFYDVQACGLPVVFEDDVVNVGRAKNDNAVTFLEGDAADFRKKMAYIVNLSRAEFSHMQMAAQQYVSENFDYKKIAMKYCTVIEEEMLRQHKGM